MGSIAKILTTVILFSKGVGNTDFKGQLCKQVNTNRGRFLCQKPWWGVRAKKGWNGERGKQYSRIFFNNTCAKKSNQTIFSPP